MKAGVKGLVDSGITKILRIFIHTRQRKTVLIMNSTRDMGFLSDDQPWNLSYGVGGALGRYSTISRAATGSQEGVKGKKGVFQMSNPTEEHTIRSAIRSTGTQQRLPCKHGMLQNCVYIRPLLTPSALSQIWPLALPNTPIPTSKPSSCKTVMVDSKFFIKIIGSTCPR
ncbi:hypothetical protein TIFTF001_018119 [Ficus carica]|uniref:Uncharacterized protein n=1 Tax=Ficus carica TaxID=3494 RepID=A0AA88ADH3_FICCA|nr:hypothetical protein TIFTF001_018119 [Ficus carica]